MRIRVLIAAALIALPVAAHADDRDSSSRSGGRAAAALREGDGVPDQLDAEQRGAYRAIFAAIHGERWADAAAKLDAMKAGPLHAIARAELYTAKNSPKIELEPLMALLADAPELPQAAQLTRMAQARGAIETPRLPALQRLTWLGSSPARQRVQSVKSDAAATEIALAIQPFVKQDRGADAEAVVEKFAADLTSDALAEWQQKVAWIYYTSGDDENARRVAAKAQAGTGDWAAQGDWVQGLAAWRQQDCEAAGAAFESVGRRAADSEMRSAGHYWASRADMACGRPQGVQAHLKAASLYTETFYGLLARQALGIDEKPVRGETFLAEDWKALERRPNVRTAAALIEIGETALADEVLRQQAKIGAASEHAALSRLAGRLSLPTTELWLSHNGPSGSQAVVEARYPAPNWTPRGRLARRQGAGVRAHAPGIALQRRREERGGGDGTDAGQARRRHRRRPPHRRDLCQLGPGQARGQHGDRPVLSRADARFAADPGAVAQGDRPPTMRAPRRCRRGTPRSRTTATPCSTSRASLIGRRAAM